MPLYEVAFTLVPSIKAQESGAEETLVVSPTAICAKNAPAAVALISALNAAKINPTDGSTLKAHIRDFPAS